MNEENDAVIRRRNSIVSTALPCFCVLMAFCGLYLKTSGTLMEMLPPLVFTACFGFIFSFLIDLHKKTSLNSPFKLFLIVLGSGLCFFVPWTLDGFLTMLVYILLVSLLCAFIGFEAGLVQLVGLCLYILAFRNEMFDRNMILNFTSIMILCVIVSFTDNKYKLISSGLIYSVFYLILCYIFRDFVIEAVFTTETIAVWLFGLAVIFFVYFTMKYKVDEDSDDIKETSAESDKETDKRTDTKADKEKDTGTDKKAVKETDTGADKKADKASDTKSDTSDGSDAGQSDEEDIDKTENKNTADIESAEAIRNDQDRTNDEVSTDEKNTVAEPDIKEKPAALSEKEKKNSNLYDCIEELSARLMKLESENSELQLMLNSSVYDLATITDQKYPYIQRLKEESPKNYAHCLKVAKTSADAAELIGCDSEEAYAIGMYIKAPKLLGDGANSMLSNTYKVPKHIISAVNKINNKANAGVMTREAGIVMLTDDIFNTIYYLRSKNTSDVSIERIVTNTIRVRKEQNFLRSAGFSNEEIQLLRLYYNDLGGIYDINDSDGE